MDLKELNYLVTIADEGSISRAAEKLFMAQSSLSQALQVFEAELGTPIFIRTSKGVRPTSSGEAFLAHARQILKHYHLAQSEVWDIEEVNGGTVKLGISTFRGTYLLPPVLARFRREHPHVHVEIWEQDSLELENLILEGLLDIALIAAPPVRLKHNVEPLLRDEILIVATKSHPVMNAAKPCPDNGSILHIDFCDAAPFEFILGPPNTVLGRIARREFRNCGMEPVGKNTMVSADLAAAMARQGIGLAVTYRSCIVSDPDVCYLRIGNRGIFLDLALVYPSGEYRSKATHALAEMFRRETIPPKSLFTD